MSSSSSRGPTGESMGGATFRFKMFIVQDHRDESHYRMNIRNFSLTYTIKKFVCNCIAPTLPCHAAHF